MKTIELTRGQVALVDDADFEWLSEFTWCASPSRSSFYALTGTYNPITGKRNTVRMHQMIMRSSSGSMVDHKDGNTLNNTRGNLRVCTPLQNQWNRRGSRSTLAGFKGVTINRSAKTPTWAANICIYGHRLALGCHATAQEAARAYDAAAIKHHGEFARLNFPS